METRKLGTLKTLLAAALAAVTLGGLSARPAHADAGAAAFLAPYVQWAKTKPQGPGYYNLGVTVVTNEPSQVVTYASAVLPYFQNSLVIGNRQAAGLVGVPPVLTNYGFSNTNADLLYNIRTWQTPGNPYSRNPFNPWVPDKVAISINARTGTLTEILQNHGNLTYTADLHVSSGVLLGTLSNGATVVISVKRVFQNIIN